MAGKKKTKQTPIEPAPAKENVEEKQVAAPTVSAEDAFAAKEKMMAMLQDQIKVVEAANPEQLKKRTDAMIATELTAALAGLTVGPDDDKWAAVIRAEVCCFLEGGFVPGVLPLLACRSPLPFVSVLPGYFIHILYRLRKGCRRPCKCNLLKWRRES